MQRNKKEGSDEAFFSQGARSEKRDEPKRRRTSSSPKRKRDGRKKKTSRKSEGSGLSLRSLLFKPRSPDQLKEEGDPQIIFNFAEAWKKNQVELVVSPGILSLVSQGDIKDDGSGLPKRCSAPVFWAYGMLQALTEFSLRCMAQDRKNWPVKELPGKKQDECRSKGDGPIQIWFDYKVAIPVSKKDSKSAVKEETSGKDDIEKPSVHAEAKRSFTAEIIRQATRYVLTLCLTDED